ncbi:MAG: dehydrogenase, partial [Gammaproteobacteria bacterium]
MKKVVSISLGSSDLDYNFKAKFLNQNFQIVRIGTDSNIRAAEKLLREWRSKADAIGLGMVQGQYWVGTNHFPQHSTRKLEKLAGDTPVSTGARLREIVQEWSLRSAQAELGSIF